MITIELNGKTREISLEDYLSRDIQDILADDIGMDIDGIADFGSNSKDIPPEIAKIIEKED